jgi:hypothetical protein
VCGAAFPPRFWEGTTAPFDRTVQLDVNDEDQRLRVTVFRQLSLYCHGLFESGSRYARKRLLPRDFGVRCSGHWNALSAFEYAQPELTEKCPEEN